MQKQLHGQQQQLQNQQRQQGSQPPPTPLTPLTPLTPRPEEKQIQYGRCQCDCPMIKDERDPERCAYCKHDHFIYPALSNELNSQGNQVTNEVRNDYDQPSPRQTEYTEYMNPMMNHMMNHQIQPPLPPPPVREPPPPNTIWFYNRNEPYYEFTNFKEGFPIKAAIREPYLGSPPDIKSWATSEHLFQAAKFKNTQPEIADKIRMCRTARDALNTARKYQQYVDPNWQSINVQVMEWVVKNKFEQHPILAKRLLDTGDQMLVEHTEVDRFWGDGGDGSGRNMLGEVLMRVRQHLRDTQSHLGNNNGEIIPSTETSAIYSMSGPASSSTSSLQASHMYAGNGDNRRISRNIEGQGSSQQPPISQQQQLQQQQQSSPPPLPPRRLEKRDLHKLQEAEAQKQRKIQQQQQQQIQQQQIQQQQIQQQQIQQQQIQQQQQQQQQQIALQQLQLQQIQQQQQYFQQMQRQQSVNEAVDPNGYIPSDETYYAHPHNEYQNM